VDVTVAVDPDQLRWALDVAGDSAIDERRADGTTVLRLRVTNRGALRSFVFGMLEHAEVLGPDTEREALVDWLEKIAQGAGRP
jgi:predicted DNA-binding transcriptional regulator YafY